MDKPTNLDKYTTTMAELMILRTIMVHLNLQKPP